MFRSKNTPPLLGGGGVTHCKLAPPHVVVDKDWIYKIQCKHFSNHTENFETKTETYN